MVHSGTCSKFLLGPNNKSTSADRNLKRRKNIQQFTFKHRLEITWSLADVSLSPILQEMPAASSILRSLMTRFAFPPSSVITYLSDGLISSPFLNQVIG